MRRDRPVILLTGFGPFPGAPRNASSQLAEELARVAVRRLPGFAVLAETLPTEWRSAPARLSSLLEELEPAVAIHFGVSHRARGFVVETRGRNERSCIPDACGEEPEDGCIAREGPAEIPATLPTGLIVERLRRLGVPVQTSRDAGGYLCNNILYQSLSEARRRKAGSIAHRRGFIHIPDGLAGPRGAGVRRSTVSALRWEEAVEGGLEILGICAAVGER